MESKVASTSNPRKRRTSFDAKQATITGMLNTQMPLQRSGPRWKKITDSVCYFLAKDMQPFDTVNDLGFRHMLSVLEPRYIPPDRKTISTNYMPQLYEKEKLSVQAQLDGVHQYSITADVWTSCFKHCYISITVHYISKSYDLQYHLLETREFSDTHTSSHIAEEIESMINNWKLPVDGLVAATTDNGTNIVSALGSLKWQHLHCFNHTLPLPVEECMKIAEVANMVGRCKSLVTHFNHSSKSYYFLRQKQIDLHHKQLNLVQDVVTR